MSELKPCPFCGGEAKIESESDQMGHLMLTGYIVKCSRCWCAPKPNNYDGNIQNVIDRWNTRHERTCIKVPGKMGYQGRKVVCSECGYGLGDDRWAFCPKCGAKVIE